MTICTDLFEHLARTTSKSLGMPDLPLVITKHPVGGLKPEEVAEKASHMIEEIVSSLTVEKGATS